jgi:AraC-like DNA-binding protein
VKLWRPDERVLMLAGRTTAYAIEPRGEYVFGVVAEQPMHARRGRRRHVVLPGQLVAWDPFGAHSGESARPWAARLMIIEADGLGNVEFPEPVLSDPVLAGDFVRLHELLAGQSTRLERDTALTTWLHTVVLRYSTARPTTTAAGDKEFRLARDYLAEHAELPVSLDELAAVAGIGKYRLVKLFRDRAGLPPHAFQIAHRVRHARRLLEAGHTPAEAAAWTGFTDQSHLHRHFRRALGFTPGQYQRLITGR